jgi:hypothetical protein
LSKHYSTYIEIYLEVGIGDDDQPPYNIAIYLRNWIKQDFVYASTEVAPFIALCQIKGMEKAL